MGLGLLGLRVCVVFTTRVEVGFLYHHWLSAPYPYPYWALDPRLQESLILSRSTTDYSQCCFAIAALQLCKLLALQRRTPQLTPNARRSLSKQTGKACTQPARKSKLS